MNVKKAYKITKRGNPFIRVPLLDLNPIQQSDILTWVCNEYEGAHEISSQGAHLEIHHIKF